LISEAGEVAAQASKAAPRTCTPRPFDSAQGKPFDSAQGKQTSTVVAISRCAAEAAERDHAAGTARDQAGRSADSAREGTPAAVVAAGASHSARAQRRRVRDTRLGSRRPRDQERHSGIREESGIGNQESGGISRRTRAARS
jgi:hypothetical protein